jgi:DNA-binding SARP family transcriptional activator
MFTAKSVSPLDKIGPYPYPLFDQAAERKLTLITAPPGYLLADSLVGTIMRRDRPLIWLRLGAEDGDPATLLLSIIFAVQRMLPDFGVETLAAMRAKPGPIYSWPPLFSSLGRELHELLYSTTAFVFENLETLTAKPETLQLLGYHLLPSFPNQSSCFLISNQGMSSRDIPELAHRIDVKDIQLDSSALVSLAECLGTPLPARQIQRIAMLSEGRAEVLVGICLASNLLGTEYLAKELERTRNRNELLENLTRTLIDQTDAQAQQALGLLVQLGYIHPSLIGKTLKEKLSVDAPWLQQLAEDWERFRRFWRPLLRNNLSGKILPNPALVNHFGSRLIAQGALPQAVRLYQWAGDAESIAREVCIKATNLLDLGQWETLRGWIDQLPASALEAYPALILYRGQISAAHGDFEGAHKTFSKAVKLSSTQGDFATACQGLLASCVVASRMGWYDHALVNAMNLVSMAIKHDLDKYRGWGLWQIGTIWTIIGKLDQAAAYFDQAMHWIRDASLGDLLDEVRGIVSAQQEAQDLLEFHTQAVQQARLKEEENASRLASILNSPAPSLEVLLKEYGWSGIPAPMSFPRYLSKSPGESLGQINPWRKLLQRVYSLRMTRAVEMDQSAQTHSTTTRLVDIEMTDQLLTLMTAMDGFLSIDANRPGEKLASELQHRDLGATGLQVPLQASGEVVSVVQPPAQNNGISSAPKLLLTTYFLGSFRVFVNDSSVDFWPSGRARSLCKYLLIHRRRAVHREKLMDVFWPSVSPDLARNSLNVAVHDLRQAFRALTDLPIIEFGEGAYLLNPSLDVWLDVEEFEHHLQACRQFEITHQGEMAIKELESATSLYQGDFLADDLYEDWTILTRERLRLDYLEILDRLSHIYFHQGEYIACASLCQLILNRDNCREDAHRLLMVCYCRQGQQYLALRQYQICCEALHSELQIEPEQATIELANRIRHHENV